ncbi:AraC-like DNA-binding protein [Chitinophaga skermanii]|uniref:AraC-like DNA-binding protein n=1 Tax=Chitinophaga skermanii TaxID=331697 RepID=A0A327Q9T5_9BACT|nr:helix-turn-helix domain-containing protein [Chitinophaga skermanii]RAJ00392.1 AraC-like DNA-binding protein [Chitinophaga skermanii]
MQSIIIKPKHPVLQQYVQYFLFFKKQDATFLQYVTFPNNNLCLAIYKENHVQYEHQSVHNDCTITQGRKSFTSKLYGFHKKPFTVEISSMLDQVCIVFYPAALKAFTAEQYNNLMALSKVEDIFSLKDHALIERIFEEDAFPKRAAILEDLLLQNLNDNIPATLKAALHVIETGQLDELSVDLLAKKLHVSVSSLFRLFTNYIGQSPKAYLKTVRFRQTLHELLHKQQRLTHIAYDHQYYDQAHFINDFKAFAGYTPKQLVNKVSIQQDDLAWIYNKP